ncbi:helix-turn-helix domain-containing protein [Chengkuizengella marina]|uniref:XRE family transcriptional regulator n=1 Tax=Chengkuizengella marina TaxID=2507566 RepID=A0A6N9Q0B8_9BACL|nr:helix-turn-helix transcriptional regulator [Chengkuizengella marina]NBI28345.1 XRE family transcriptional regulator [Chengkuizengella marina]
MNKMITYTTHSTLGELIRHHRKQAEMTLAKLSELTNFHKPNLSRIESGRTKRPTLATIQKIGSVLEIPYEEWAERYIEIEERSEVLLTILNDFIHSEDIQFLKKLSKKILQSPNEDSVDLVEKLYSKIENIKETSIKLDLYQMISNYSLTHGIMPYFTKSLLQTYLIERDDFSRLRSTYSSGKSIIEFEEFLNSDEKGIMYYKLSVHAYNLCLFKESIELGKKALDEKIRDRMRANTILAVCNSYYRLSDFKQTKQYYFQYKKFSLAEVKDNCNLIKSNLYSLSEDYQLAISVLQGNLTQYGDDSLLHAVNQLIALYFQTNNLPKIQHLIELEEKLLSIPCVTPFKKAELALYFRLKGEYFTLTGRVEEGIECYLEAAKQYGKIDLIANESECLQQITYTNNKSDAFYICEKLGTYYNDKVRKGVLV